MKVLSGAKTLVQEIVQYYTKETFGHLLSRLDGDSFAETNGRVQVTR